MRLLALAVCLASTLTLAPVAGAQPVRACPPGEAVRELDPGGKVQTCIPVPAPVDSSAINAAIANEAAARTAGDMSLNGRVDAEAVARMQADDELRNGEGGLNGRYAVVGTGLCTRGTANTPGFGTSPEFAPLPGSTVQQQSFTYSGVREFDPATGTIHGTSTVYNITYPAAVLGGGVTTSTNGGAVVQFEQNWTYVLGAERSITITGAGSQGTIVQGVGGIGNLVSTHGAPSLTGSISKDWRTIVLSNAGMAVEHSITTSPSGAQLVDIPRVCTRTETMTKIAD